jgi:hypothetical protein
MPISRKLSGCYECHSVFDPRTFAAAAAFPCSDCGEVFGKAESLDLHKATRHAGNKLYSFFHKNTVKVRHFALFKLKLHFFLSFSQIKASLFLEFFYVGNGSFGAGARGHEQEHRGDHLPVELAEEAAGSRLQDRQDPQGAEQ